MMNIFELTRILNEVHAPVVGEIGKNAKTLQNIAKKTKDDGVIEDVENFFNKINNLLLKKIDIQDVNSNYSQVVNRISDFMGGSNENVTSMLNEILSLLTDDMMNAILQLSPKDLYNTTSLSSIFNYRDGRTIKKNDIEGRNKNKNIKNFLVRMAKFRAGSCGPFEILLCLLFNGSKVNVAKKGDRGDVEIDGINWEVKGDGGGCIDTGIDNIEHQMKNAKGSEFKNLMNQLEKAKQLFNVLDSKGSKLMEQFAKKLTLKKREELETNITNTLKGKNTMTSSDVENYFSLLDDEEKKKAVLYGFYQLGYKNLIVCGWDANNTIKVIKGEDIKKCIFDTNVTISSALGIDLTISGNSKTYDDGSTTAKTANFGSYIIKIV